MSADGLKLPLYISSGALIGVIFDGGIFYNKINTQETTIAKLEGKLENSRDSSLGERVARCESDVAALKAEDLELKDGIKTLWRVRGGGQVPP